MVRAGGVSTSGMDKRGRAEDKGKGDDGKLIGIKKKKGHIDIVVVCLIKNRLLGSFLCSAESTSVVAVKAVGVLGAFTPEVEDIIDFSAFILMTENSKSHARTTSQSHHAGAA